MGTYVIFLFPFKLLSQNACKTAAAISEIKAGDVHFFPPSWLCIVCNAAELQRFNGLVIGIL